MEKPELIESLQAVADWQDHMQGQLEALQTALAAILQTAGPASPVAARTRAALEDWRLMMVGDKATTKALLDGFDSANQRLSAAMTALPPSTAH